MEENNYQPSKIINLNILIDKVFLSNVITEKKYIVRAYKIPFILNLKNVIIYLNVKNSILKGWKSLL